MEFWMKTAQWNRKQDGMSAGCCCIREPSEIRMSGAAASAFFSYSALALSSAFSIASSRSRDVYLFSSE